jgi:cysteinyl-tRNA synthetase
MHNAFITFNGEKVSKSTGGLYTIFDLEEIGFTPLAFRYMVLSSHYRRGISFSVDSLKTAQIALNKLRDFLGGKKGEVSLKYKKQFEEKITNDLAMPEVMALVWRLMKDEKVRVEDRRATLLDFDKVLGLKLNETKTEEIPTEIESLAKERLVAKEAKNWTESDRLRDLIKEKGYVVEDLPKSYKIRKL